MKESPKFNLNFLQKYCEENNVELLEDYSNIALKGDTFIKGKCIYENCQNSFEKKFKYICEIGSYCKNCCKIISKNRRKQTCLNKYGVDNHTKTENYKNSFKSTKFTYNLLEDFCKLNSIKLLKNYSIVKLQSHSYIEGNCQNIDCKNTFNKKFFKLINTNGLCNPCVYIKAKEVRKQTNLKNIGFENYFQNEKIKEKIKETNKSKYGVEYVAQSQHIKEKFKQTCLKNYGVEHMSHCPEIQEKIKQTNIKKYGVEHLMKKPEYLEQMLKKSYKFKDFIMPSGKIIQIQGYEHIALNELIINEKINESDIITGAINVPEIEYFDKNNNKRKHFPDIFIPKQNRIIEVKSTWTFQKDNVLIRQSYGKKLGYQYEIWVYDKKGNKTCYD